jgi:hypothetical protein
MFLFQMTLWNLWLWGFFEESEKEAEVIEWVPMEPVDTTEYKLFEYNIN